MKYYKQIPGTRNWEERDDEDPERIIRTFERLAGDSLEGDGYVIMYDPDDFVPVRYRIRTISTSQ